MNYIAIIENGLARGESEAHLAKAEIERGGYKSYRIIAHGKKRDIEDLADLLNGRWTPQVPHNAVGDDNPAIPPQSMEGG